MKNLILKSALLLVLVAVLVTGAVLTASAGNTPATSKAGDNYFICAGARLDNYDDPWQLGSYSVCKASGGTSLPSGEHYYDEGYGIWLDFEYYYDPAYTTTPTHVYLRDNNINGTSSHKKISILSISGGQLIAPAVFLNSGTIATLPGMGWHHVQMKLTQEYDVSKAAEGYVGDFFMEVFLNGVSLGRYETDTYAASDVGWDKSYYRFYDADASGNLSDRATFSNETLYMYFYGENMFAEETSKGSGVPKATTPHFLSLRNSKLSYGTDPRVSYAPITLSGASQLVTTVEQEAKSCYPSSASKFDNLSDPGEPLEGVTHYYLTDWKNFYDPAKDDLSAIKLPAIQFDIASKPIVGWYADAAYTQKIDALSPDLIDENGVISLYARTYYDSKSAFEIDGIQSKNKWYMLPGEYENANGDIWQLTFASTTRQFAVGESYNFELDYYFEKDVTKTDIELRLRRGVNSAPFKVENGVVYLLEEAFTGETGMRQIYTMEENGWHHIAINYTQTTDFEAKKHNYVMTVYVDGVSVGSFSPNAAAISKKWETANGGWRLYTETVDSDGNWTGIEQVKDSKGNSTNIYWFIYGGSFYKSSNGLYDTSRHMLMVRNVHIYCGFVDTLTEISRISYELNGGKMPTASIDSASSDYFSGARFYHPFKDADGNTLVYDYATNQNYYTPNATYTLPIPTKMGATFLGWYTSADFSGAPVTDTEYLSGDVTLYAKFSEGIYSATLTENNESVVYENCASVDLPASVEYWLSDGELIAGGTTVELTGDKTFIAVTADLLTGASVRLNQRSGIRFETAVSKDLLAALEAAGMTSYKLGTLITVADLLSGAFTAEAMEQAGITYVNLTSNDDGVQLSDDGENLIFYASVIDILETNYVRKFTAISYLEFVMNGTTYLIYSDYHSGDNSRTIYEVAKIAHADKNAGYTDGQKAIMEAFINGVVQVEAALDKTALKEAKLVKPYATYTSSYVLSYDVNAATITITKPADLKLVTVIFNSEVYTGGWRISEDGTQITIPYGTPKAAQ